MCDYEWLRAMVEAVHLDHVLCIWCWFEKWLQGQNQKIGVAHSELTCVAGNWYLLDVLLLCWGSVTSMWTRRPTWNGFRLLPKPWAGKPPQGTGHPQLAASLPPRGFKNIFPVDSLQPGVDLIDSAIQVHSRFICIIHIYIYTCSIQFFISEHPLLPDEMPSLWGFNLQNMIFSQVMLTSRVGVGHIIKQQGEPHGTAQEAPAKEVTRDLQCPGAARLGLFFVLWCAQDRWF